MINENPLVSIIIPVYNGSNFLSEAIDSALSQTYENIEVIVVNDGSNDDGKTRNIALSYGYKIRYFEKENGGVATALNLGIKKMKGEYFSWLSHDDLYCCNKVEKEIDALKKTGNMEQAVYSDCAYVKWPEKIMVQRTDAVGLFGKACANSGMFASAFIGPYGCALLIPRSYFVKYGLFDEKYRAVQDSEKWLEMFWDNKLLYIDEVLVTCRLHEAQISNIYEGVKSEGQVLLLDVLDRIMNDNLQDIGFNRYIMLSFFYDFCYCPFERKTKNCMIDKIQELDEPHDLEGKISELSDTLTNHGKRKVYIYCLGIRGKRLLNSFALRNIHVDGVSDSNPKLWGSSIGAYTCASPTDLDKNALVIITKRYANDLKEELEQQGFQKVVTSYDLYKFFLQAPIKKDLWLHQLGSE